MAIASYMIITNSDQQHLSSTYHSISYAAPIRFPYPIMNILHNVNSLQLHQSNTIDTHPLTLGD